MITARDSLQDKVSGLHIGANDYITKPFFKSELTARIELHLTLQGLTQDREQSRQQIATNEAHLDIMLRSIADAVIVTDTSGFVTRCNPVALELVGMKNQPK